MRQNRICLIIYVCCFFSNKAFNWLWSFTCIIGLFHSFIIPHTKIAVVMGILILTPQQSCFLATATPLKTLHIILKKLCRYLGHNV